MTETLRRSKSPGSSEAEASHTAASALIPLIVRNARDLIAFLDVEGRRIYNSPSYGPLLGDPDALVGTDSFADIHADDRERVRAVFRDTVRSGHGYRIEYRLIARDGPARVVQSEGSVIRADDNRVVGVVVVGRDVTEERHAEAQVAMALRRQKALSELSRLGVRSSTAMPVLERASSLLAEVLGCEFASVMELQPEGREFRILTGHGRPAHHLGASLSAGLQSQAGHALALYDRSEAEPLVASRALVYENIREQPFYATSPLLHELDVQSGISVVIPGALRPYGVLSAFARASRRFHPAEVDFAQACANVLTETIERCRVQAALQESEDRYRDLVEHSENLICTHDLDGRLLSVNPWAAKCLGYEREAMLKKDMREFLHPATRPEFDAYLARIRTEGAASGLLLVRTRSGETRVWEYRNTLRADGVPAPVVRGMAHDISDRLRAEEELRESEERFRTLTELSSDFYWEQDAEYRFVRRVGTPGEPQPYPLEDILGKTRWELPALNLGPAEWAKHRAELDERREFHDLEIERSLPLGESRWISTSGRPMFDSSGNFCGYRGIGKVITQRKRAEQELRARAEGDRALIDLGLIGLREQDARALLQNTIQIVGRTLGVDLAKVLELLPDGSGLKLVAGTGWKPGLLGHATVGADLDSQAGYTIHEYEAAKRLGIERFAAVIVANLAKEQRFSGPALLKEHGVVSGMSVVIPGAERPWGVLGVHSRTPRRFERREADFLQAAANMLSAALARCAAHTASQESEARFRSLIELSSDWYWEQDERFRFTLIAGPGASAGAGGGDPSIYLGKARWECGDLEPHEGDWAPHRARLERHGPFRDAVFRRSMSDGSTRYMSVSGEPVFGEDGRFAGFRGVGSDITQRKLAEQALAESEQRYRTLFEAGPEAMYLFDRESLAILAVNPRMVELYGWSHDQLLSMTMLDLRPPAERAFVEGEVRSRTSNRTRTRRRHWRSNGEVFDAEITSRLVDYAGRPAEMVVITDVTARQRAEQVLREQRRLLARAQDLAGLGYWEYDPATGAMQGSRELRRMLDLGVDLPAQTAEWSLNLVHPEDREHVRAAVQKAIDQGSSYELEARVPAADGTPRILVISGEAVKDDAGRVTKVIGSCLDITEQRERENALCEAADQLQALSRRLVETQETERRRLATELHDRVGQNLTALGINLDILARRMSGLDADARHRLEESHSLIVATTRSVAGVLDDLHPPMLDDLGLGPTLRWAAQDFSRRTEIPTKVSVDGVERRIDRQNELALLRIVQEALTNVAKHAGARTVGITLVWQPEALQVEVADDGVGFECSGSRGHTGLGLATMRERTLAAHGQLDIDSAPGRGTRVRALVPG